VLLLLLLLFAVLCGIATLLALRTIPIIDDTLAS
jgi:hypothetical protein